MWGGLVNEYFLTHSCIVFRIPIQKYKFHLILIVCIHRVTFNHLRIDK